MRKKINKTSATSLSFFKEKLLPFLFALLLPTQLGKHFFFDFSFIHGVRVDYLSPTIFLIDCLLILFFILHIKTLISKLNKKFFLVILIFVCINSFFSLSPWLSLYSGLRLMEIFILYTLFSQKRLPITPLVSGLTIGAIIELVLCVIQLKTGQSLQGFFYFLGERAFSLSTPGIAKISFRGMELLRPYGTFSHPNSLGGFYTLIYALLLTTNVFRKKSKLHFILLFLSASLIFLSFSKIAILSFLGLSLFKLWSEKRDVVCKLCLISKTLTLAFSSLVFFLFTSDPLTIDKRLFLAKNSLDVIFKFFWSGTGLGAYLLALPDIASPYIGLIYQPVHNVFLLYLAQTGFIGVIFILILRKWFISMIRQYPYVFAVLFATGMVDHYWMSLIQNILLLGVVFGVLRRKAQNF